MKNSKSKTNIDNKKQPTTQSIPSLKSFSRNNSIQNLSAIKSTKNENKQQSGDQKSFQFKLPNSKQGSQVLKELNQGQEKGFNSNNNSTVKEDLNESYASSQASIQSELNAFNAGKRNRILNFLIFLCESEIFLEKLRQKACSFSEFEPYAVFQRFNREMKKELEAVDIENFMTSLNQKIDSNTIKTLMWFYDLDRNNSLSYIEFMTIVLTVEDDDLRTKISVRPTYKVSKEQFLPLHMEVAIGKLFYQQFNIQNIQIKLNIKTISRLVVYFEKIDEFRSQLENDFNLQEFLDAFKFLDKEGKGELHEEGLIDFLQEQSYNPSQILARNILRNFKGKNADFIEQDEENIIGYDENGNPIYKKTIDPMKFVRFLVPNMSKDVIKHAFDIHYKKGVKTPVRVKYTFEIRREWLEIFKQRVEPEKEIEYCKQDLCMQKDFSAKDMFVLINSDKNDYISISEFVDSLKELGVQPYKDEIYLFFRRHAANKNKGLREDEFIYAILPNQHTYDKVAQGRINISDQTVQLRMKDILQPETLRRFKKLMLALLKFELKMEAICLKLAKLTHFSYEDFFELLDQQQNGYISLTDLKQVFIDHKIDVTEKELSFLFKRLDCKEKDDKISYIEFINEAQPHLPKNLIARRFTSKERQKQAQSMANFIDTDLNLKSRADFNSAAQTKTNFSIHSLTQLNND
ncbi:hypothetical protein ABPG74_018644 [Tetrahymena malaccensis]